MVKKENDLTKYIEFVETKKMSLSGYTLIEGFPDLGLAGTIGSRYLIEKLDFEQIGYIESRLFLPIIRIEKGLPLHPVRIYASKKHKTVIIIAEQIISNNIASPFAKAIMDWVKKKKIKSVIATSGIRVPNGKSVYAFASNEKGKKAIKKNKIELINGGISSGVTAMLMLEFKDNNIEAFCLMGNAKNNADYESASEIVKAFGKLIGFELDVKPLLEEAKKLEKAILSHLKTMQAQKKQDKLPDQAKIDTPMYT
jgi:uncharacterized protein